MAHGRRLAPQDRDRIARTIVAQSLTDRQAAERFGISVTTVELIRRRAGIPSARDVAALERGGHGAPRRAR